MLFRDVLMHTVTNSCLTVTLQMRLSCIVSMTLALVNIDNNNCNNNSKSKGPYNIARITAMAKWQHMWPRMILISFHLNTNVETVAHAWRYTLYSTNASSGLSRPLASTSIALRIYNKSTTDRNKWSLSLWQHAISMLPTTSCPTLL